MREVSRAGRSAGFYKDVSEDLLVDEAVVDFRASDVYEVERVIERRKRKVRYSSVKYIIQF